LFATLVECSALRHGTGRSDAETTGDDNMTAPEFQHGGDGGHTSEDRAAVNEFNIQDAADALRRGHHVRVMAQADEAPADAPAPRPRKTRGGTREQHMAAGAKGGSRIRQLIELGYKYEQEHGIGPGQNDRSRRRQVKSNAGRADG
jgi:hypothetical protein